MAAFVEKSPRPVSLGNSKEIFLISSFFNENSSKINTTNLEKIYN